MRKQMASTLLYEAGLHRSKGELDSAVVAFSKALELDPGSFSAYNNRGLTFLEKKRYEDAIAETRKNLKNLTRYTVAWFVDLKKKYGKGRERRTKIQKFEKVVASVVMYRYVNCGAEHAIGPGDWIGQVIG